MKVPYTSVAIQQAQNSRSKPFNSVNQLSVYGAVANWCHQFGLTEEEKGRANFSVHNMSLFLVHFFSSLHT